MLPFHYNFSKKSLRINYPNKFSVLLSMRFDVYSFIVQFQVNWSSNSFYDNHFTRWELFFMLQWNLKSLVDSQQSLIISAECCYDSTEVRGFPIDHDKHSTQYKHKSSEASVTTPYCLDFLQTGMTLHFRHHSKLCNPFK